MPKIRSLAAFLVLFTLLTPATTFVTGQRTAIDVYAITNAKIVTVSGPVIERGTIVIRDGLIAAVGDKVNAPADARVIDGTGLTVYPGLFDANTNLGLPVPSPAATPGGGGGFQQAQLRATTPVSGPNSTQPPGLQPETMAEDSIKPGGPEIEAARNAGITTALTAPRTGIWMGQSALINLAGDSPQQMIVKSPVAMHVGFSSLRTGGYPGSLMGVFSSLRQMLLDAQQYQKAQEVYEHTPRGMRRPELDRSLAALIPVLEGKLVVVMYADRQREIERALDLAQEFKLRAIIAGGVEAETVAERLRERDVPVLLSLNFPKRTTAAAPEADPETMRTLRGRVEALKSAAKLAAAKVRFAFESGGLTNMADFRGNVAKAIENGLSHENALRALTIQPAEIFGVADRLGTIEVGKIANLTVTRGDIFDRNTRVTYVFIDGRPAELRPAAPAPGSSSGTSPSGLNAEETRPNFDGTWTINLALNGQTVPGTLVLRREEGAIAGSIQTHLGTSEFRGGAITGNAFHVVFGANIQGQAVDITMDATIQGNDINGTAQSVFGTATLTGSRQP
ncbi:MAG: amidohydrolase family protein [Acidobacteriota bacterium]|nr:amidohydrolase family protein [Acidobacteriota bacterium]